MDADNRLIEQGRYLLSLKDMNQSANIGRMIEAGAVSFKIEGRLKDAAYVKNVVSAYSRLIDQYIERHPAAYCRASLGRCTYSFDPDLRKTFNRGFTTYFADGRQPDISSPDTPKAIGEYVGKVKEIRGASFNVAGTASFANGDGLCFINNRRELEGFRVNRVEGNRIFPLKMPRELRPGMALYRNNDKAFEDILSRPVTDRRIAIDMALNVVEGGFSLSASISGDASPHTSIGIRPLFFPFDHQQAKRPQREGIIANLSKLGGTIFECTDVELPDDFDLFIPNSMLGEMRRKAVEYLEEEIIKWGKRTRENRQAKLESEGCSDESINKNSSVVSQPWLEASPGELPLMQCRYCLRHAMGYCTKQGGRKADWREPLFLTLPDGKRFRLEFDCKRCQMNVYSSFGYKDLRSQ